MLRQVFFLELSNKSINRFFSSQKQEFLCQLTHGCSVERNGGVISCGLHDADRVYFLIMMNERKVWRYQRDQKQTVKQEKDKQYIGKKKKDKRTENDTENSRSSSTNLTEHRGWTQLLWQCKRSSYRNTLVANPVIGNEWGNDRIKITTPHGHFRGHLWNRHSVTVNQVLVATINIRSDDFNFTNQNPWFSSFLVSSNHLSRKSW